MQDLELMPRRGEMTASALEAHLTTLEDKMDQILAVFDAKDTLPEELTPVQDQETSNGFPTKNNSHTNQGETTPDQSQ